MLKRSRPEIKSRPGQPKEWTHVVDVFELPVINAGIKNLTAAYASFHFPLTDNAFDAAKAFARTCNSAQTTRQKSIIANLRQRLELGESGPGHWPEAFSKAGGCQPGLFWIRTQRQHANPQLLQRQHELRKVCRVMTRPIPFDQGDEYHFVHSKARYLGKTVLETCNRTVRCVPSKIPARKSSIGDNQTAAFRRTRGRAVQGWMRSSLPTLAAMGARTATISSVYNCHID